MMESDESRDETQMKLLLLGKKKLRTRGGKIFNFPEESERHSVGRKMSKEVCDILVWYLELRRGKLELNEWIIDNEQDKTKIYKRKTFAEFCSSFLLVTRCTSGVRFKGNFLIKAFFFVLMQNERKEKQKQKQGKFTFNQ